MRDKQALSVALLVLLVVCLSQQMIELFLFAMHLAVAAMYAF